MQHLNLFSFFHLNLMFSSIEENQRIEVINKCYWPILNLASEYKIPIGVEATGLTLELISELDKSWIDELKKLIELGLCEFIGSGYSQIIAPIVPYEINLHNQIIGKRIYKKILNIDPKVALINEQAFSSNLIPLYKDTGYETIIMEWNNSVSFKNWDAEIGLFRQKVISQCDSEIDIVWNNSINFQKFQRYIHSEISLNEFINFVNISNQYEKGNYLLYGSDAEIFNFRPGRFSNEANIKNCEWEKIEDLYSYFKENKKYKFIFPSQVNFNSNKIKRLILNSPQEPITVKKQSKYNIFRWGLTGRNDLEINTKCYEILERLKNNPNSKEKYIKTLCYLWSSDFRTHITKNRWIKFQKKLKHLDKETRHLKKISFINREIILKKNIDYKFKDNLIVVSYDETFITFNLNKGLVIDSFKKNGINSKSIFGTIKHGTFNDINWSADFYSGNLNFQSPGKPQVTDMEKTMPEIISENNQIILKSIINTNKGYIKKEWIIDASLDVITLKYYLSWENADLGKLSIVPITFNPYFFDKNSTYFLACNGTEYPEKYLINDLEIDHTKNVSFLVSSHHGLGMTDGRFVIGDDKNNIEIIFQPSKCAFLGQVLNKKIDNIYFTRFLLTAREFDDTAKYSNLLIDTEISYKINFSK